MRVNPPCRIISAMNTVPIREWIDGQPNQCLATFAAAVARWGCELPGMLTDCRKHWPSAPPDARLWLDLYRDHRGVAGAVQSAMPGGPDTVMAADLSRAVEGVPPEELRGLLESIAPEDWQAAVKAGQEQATVFQHAMAAVAYNDIPGAMKLGGFSAELSIEHRFYMLVAVPYVIEHGEWPTRDFASARRGDPAAMERLMAFDRAVVGEPMIAKQMADGCLSGRPAFSRLLARAMDKKPPAVKVSRCKMLAAALIIELFKNAGMPIGVADVRALFDALARSDRGKLMDSDLPDSPEAMTKGIQRYKKFWRPMVERMAGRGSGQKLS